MGALHDNDRSESTNDGGDLHKLLKIGLLALLQHSNRVAFREWKQLGRPSPQAGMTQALAAIDFFFSGSNPISCFTGNTLGCINVLAILALGAWFADRHLLVSAAANKGKDTHNCENPFHEKGIPHIADLPAGSSGMTQKNLSVLDVVPLVRLDAVIARPSGLEHCHVVLICRRVLLRGGMPLLHILSHSGNFMILSLAALLSNV